MTGNLRLLPALLLLMIAVAAAAALALATPHGLGISTDSVVYRTAAANLVETGRMVVPAPGGKLEPLTRFPPGYPALLAGSALLGGDIDSGARALAILLLAVNVFLTGWIVMRSSEHVGLGVAAALFVALALPVMESHTWEWSEPAFMAGMLGLALALEAHLAQATRWAWNLALLMAGSVALTRYAGVALAVAAGVVLASWDEGARWARLLRASTFVVAATAPLGFWMLLNLQFVGTASGREPTFLPPGSGRLYEALDTISGWLMPRFLPFWPRVLAAAGLIGAVALAGRMLGGWHQAGRNPRLPVLFLSFAAVYASLIGIALTFLDADIPLDDRILLPLFLTLLVMATWAIAPAYRSNDRKSRAIRQAAAVVGACLLALHATRTTRLLAGVREQGLGYANHEWRTSALVSWVRTNRPAGLVSSNFPDALTFQTGVVSEWLPWKADANAGRARVTEYARELQQLDRRLQDEQGVIVLFDRARRMMPSRPELETALHIRSLAELSDGAVFASVPRAP